MAKPWTCLADTSLALADTEPAPRLYTQTWSGSEKAC